jgi:hypothetical protein
MADLSIRFKKILLSRVKHHFKQFIFNTLKWENVRKNYATKARANTGL